MTKKEINSKAVKLFNRWKKEFRYHYNNPDPKHWEKYEQFKKECYQLHNVTGAYDYLTDKNALKMASICSAVRFVQPYRMLMQLQKTTKTY